MEVIAATIDPQIDAGVAKLRMIVDQQGFLLMTLHEIHGEMHSESGSSYSALGPEEREDRAARGISDSFGRPLRVKLS